MPTRRMLLQRSVSAGLTARLGWPIHARAGEPAVPLAVAPADSLVDFVAVQTHLNRDNPAWDRSDWRPLFGDLGVRRTRSNLANRRARDHLLALNAEYGIKACGLVTAINDDGTFDFDKAAKRLAFMRDEIGPDRIFAIEGPNEYTKDFKSGDWATRLIDFQKFLFSYVEQDKVLGSLDVLAPTIWRRKVEDYSAISGILPYADYGNLHLYIGGRKPSLFSNEGFDQPIDIAIKDAQRATPGKPICVTETGFKTAVDGRLTSQQMPADIVAKYTLRMIAELFLRRDVVQWVSIYILIDYSEGSDYGLLGTDLTPRPVYFALRNMIRLLADPGPVFKTSTFPCELKAEDGLVRWFFLQKRDGRYFIVLWNDAESYDRRARKSVDHPPRPVVLDFGDRKIESLLTYRPNVSEQPQEIFNGARSATLSVGDEITIAEVRP